jgi:hypothetical protein
MIDFFFSPLFQTEISVYVSHDELFYTLSQSILMGLEKYQVICDFLYLQ